MSAVKELKPCPFCGGQAEIHPSNDWDAKFTGATFFAWCDECETRGDYYNTEAEAIAAWNTRADDNEDVVTCFNCGAQIDMLGMFTPLAKSSVLYRHYATYCPACGERLVG